MAKKAAAKPEQEFVWQVLYSDGESYGDVFKDTAAGAIERLKAAAMVDVTTLSLYRLSSYATATFPQEPVVTLDNNN